MTEPPIHVLLIDDDEDSPVLIGDILGEIPGRYRLTWVATTGDAFARIHEHRIDVCLIDWFLGPQTGSGALTELRDSGYDGAAIILTGVEDPDADTWSEQAGVADYLLKSEVTGYLLDRSIRYALRRAETERTLRDSERRYRDLFENAVDAVIYSDPVEDRLLAANAAAEELFGAPAEWILQQTRAVLFDMADPRSLAAQEERDASGWCAREVAVRIADGSIIPARGRSRLYVDQEGRTRAITVLHDLRQAKVARESAAALATIVRSSRDAIVGMTRDGRVTSWNDAAEALYGYTAAEATGRSFDELVATGADRSLLRTMMTSAASQANTEPIETTTMSADGRAVEVSIIVSPIVTGDGTVTGLSAICRDITAHKRAEELRLLQERAEAATAAKSDLLRVTSHEFRTPLAGILGFAQVLQLSELSERDSRAVDYIVRSAQHLQRLVEDFLELATIEADRFTIAIERVDACEVAEEVVRMLTPVAETNHVDMSIETPSGAAPVWVRADRHRTLQVLLNLISNAIKYNYPGGRVVVRVQPCCIAVEDTGRGIPAEFLPRIFEPFARHESTADQVEGTGLGLPIVKSLLDAMSGSITIDTALGRGSTFLVRLPAWTAAAPGIDRCIPAAHAVS